MVDRRLDGLQGVLAVVNPEGPKLVGPVPKVKMEAVGTPEQELNFLKWLIDLAERHHESIRKKTEAA